MDIFAIFVGFFVGTVFTYKVLIPWLRKKSSSYDDYCNFWERF